MADLFSIERCKLELRHDYGVAVLMALVRIASRPIGLITSNCVQPGGAIDAQATDKVARSM